MLVQITQLVKRQIYIYSFLISLLLSVSAMAYSQYCTPCPTNGPHATYQMIIESVDLVDIFYENTSYDECYTDLTPLGYTTNLGRGESYSLDVKTGSSSYYYGIRYAAWIDYNNDSDFDDAGEKLGEQIPPAASAVMSFPFTVPAGATLGPTRLRVRCVWGTDNINSCTDYSYGETEDFTVFIPEFEVIDSVDDGNYEPTSVAWADINNDGYLDAVYTAGYEIDIKQNNGDGTFTVINTGHLPPTYGAIIPGDYNRDNYVDLLVTGKRAAHGSPYLSYVLKNTGGSFVDINANLEPLKESSGDWGDFDNDGDLDILLIGLGDVDPVAMIYENIGNDEFIEFPVFFKGISQGDCQWFDFNNDSYLDVIVSGLNIDGNSDITIYENMHGEGFSELEFPFLNIMGVFDIGDYDQDGDQDIIITGEENKEPWGGGSPITALYRNDSTGFDTYTLIETGIQNLKEADVKFGDADNDGDLDIFVSGRNVLVADQYLRVYYNEGGDVFTYRDIDNMPAVYLPDLDLGDFDNDNDLDFIYVGHDNMVRIVENHSALPNTKPSPPGSFASEMIGNGIFLQWSLGNDNETLQPGLTYNIKVGTSSGAYDIVGPGSNPATGQMKFRNKGYLNHDSNVLISGLPIGTYYWSVQSVDNNYSGSSFGAEQTIEVMNPFTQIDPGFPQVAGGQAEWCDFNSDGNQDLILTGGLSSGVSTTVWYNNTGDSFTAYANNEDLVDVRNSTVSLYDYDGDNDIDLMYYGGDAENQTFSKFYENLGTSFSEIAMPFYTATGAEWGDVDNDGDADFIGRNSVLKNDGLNNFSWAASVSGYSLKAFDADNDGDLDIFSPQYGKIHFNDGTGAYIESTYTLEPLEAFTSDIGDYNNDGYLDILVSGRTNSTRVSFVYRNNKDATFTDINANIRAIESGRVSWLDYENDGDLDVSMCGGSSTDITRVFLNMENDLFSEISVNLPENDDQDIDWADYDNDGDMDLIYLGTIGNTRITNIYRNNNNFQNQIPVTPGSLSANIEGKKATLSWHKADTIETMSYNVRIGTSSGAYDILAPQSHPGTGKPFLQKLGNAQMNSFKIIENLEVGTYYWSVEALDKNFKNSNWSTESSFTVNVLQADFNAADVCDGETMTFSDASLTSGVSIDSWSYDFGDGNTSTLQNPSHVYTSDGTYVVMLFITSGVYSDSTSKFVTVNKNPIPNFTSNNACQGIEPVITNTTDLNGLTLSSWHWDFGNGVTSSDQTPVNPGLLIAGNYEVKLTVSTIEMGCVDSISKTVTVSPYPEAAISANGPVNFCDGDSVILSVAKNITYNYAWKESGVNIAGEDSSKYYARQTGDYTVEVVNPVGNCSNTSSQATVGVAPTPSSLTIGVSGSISFCEGDSVSLSVTDNADFTYFWKRDGGLVGTNSNILRVESAGIYSLEIENSSGCTNLSSNEIIVTVYAKPFVPSVSVGGATTLCDGEFVELSVPDDPAMTYQWMKGVIVIGGEITTVYDVTETGAYHLNILNGDGCTSETVPVFVLVNPTPTSPTIGQSGSATFCEGDSVVLSVTDDPLLSYRWMLEGGTIGADLNKVTAISTGAFSMEVSNASACTAISSNTITVAVNPNPIIPTVNVVGATTFCDGETVSLSVTNDPAMTYQWYNGAVTVGGATTNSLLADVTGVYNLNIINGAGCMSETVPTPVTVNPSPAAPTISLSGSSTFCAGGSVTLSVTDDPLLTYQWKLGGGATGADQNTHIVTSSGTYSLEVSNASLCTALSNTVAVTVHASPVIPTVGVNGVTAFCEGQSVELSVTNNPSVTYQWKDGELNVGGATGNSYTATATGDYKLTIANGDGCTVETQIVSVIADPAPTSPTIGYTGSLEFCDMDSLVLNVVDNPNYTYEWQLNGGTVGTSSSSYAARATGDYKVRVQNLGDCSVMSVNTVSLIVHASPTSPTLNLSGPTTFCNDTSVSLSVADPGTDTYQWISGLGEMTDETGTSITVEETGLYKVRVRNAGMCEAFSQEISVTVDAYPIEPVILSDNYEADGCPDNDPVSLSIQSVENGVSYQWSKDGNVIGGASGDTYSGYLDEGSYKVEADNNGCKIESQSQTISYGEMPEKPTILAEGSAIWYLACSNDSASAYKWYLDGMLIEGADDYLYVAGTQEGKFEVAISENTSCFAKSDPVWIPLGTDIDLDPWENLKIYPNPTPGLFTLEMDNHLMGELIIDIFGETGSKIINIKFQKETAHFKTQIDLSEQPPAAYLIGLMLEEYRTNRTLIVE